MKAVVRETGLKADTIRAWERRYNLPQPGRTSGGHRLYSKRDIETIQWLLARQNEGLSISRAVNLWRSIEREGNDPLATEPYAMVSPPVISPTGAEIDALRERWIEACEAFNEQTAEQILTQAFALYPPDVVSLELLAKGLAQIGTQWYRGELTVQQEHFASELAIRRLEALIAATPPPTVPGRIIVMCPPEEEHTFSPLLITFLLRRSGRAALFLGANVPLDRLDHAIQSTRPQLVVLASQQLHTAASLRQVAVSLQEKSIPVAYGGGIFNRIPALRERIPGTFLGEQFDQVPVLVGELINQPVAPEQILTPSPATLRTLEHFKAHQAEIDSHIWRAMQPNTLDYNHLAIANINLARNITAALSLGDMQFLGNDLEWIDELLGHRQIPRELLVLYLEMYAQAVEEIMGARGEQILAFFSELLQQKQ